MPEYEEYQTAPVGTLGIIAMPGCEELGQRIDRYLTSWRAERDTGNAFQDYHQDTYLVKYQCPRFGTGEAKGVILESVRGHDIFIVCDVFNYGITYKMYRMDVPMSPDDHFADLKRIIAAIGGKARRITVIMPMLYEGRQHKRASRESLDCAQALHELIQMGVDNIITFDAHDARVQNAIPLKGFENVQATYQMIKALVRNVDNLELESDRCMIISPDEGGMQRCIYYSTALGLKLGMFYKRRDYTVVVNGRNPIVAHEYLGDNVDGKDVIIADDMISSGDSVIEIGRKLKALGAERIFICTTFGLFCEGLERFDEAYRSGYFTKIFTTNLVYRTNELLAREWYVQVDMSKYISYIIDNLNHDSSVSGLLNPSDRIQKLLDRHRAAVESRKEAQTSFLAE